jgi:hypothetical protein
LPHTIIHSLIFVGVYWSILSRSDNTWVCLLSQGHYIIVLVTIHIFFNLFLHFSITINFKTFLLFSLFISHKYFFITIQIKKFTIIQNSFTFLYKFFLFYTTSLLFTNFKTNNSLLCYLPNKTSVYALHHMFKTSPSYSPFVASFFDFSKS